MDAPPAYSIIDPLPSPTEQTSPNSGSGHRASLSSSRSSVLTRHRGPSIASSHRGSANVEPLPPEYYSLPPTFGIGRKHTPHLVNVAQIKGHLALLNAFTNLQSHVRGLTWSPADSEEAIRDMPFNVDTRWVWFVSMAVERFQLWCEALHSNDLSRPVIEFLPPIDVLMVWHAYLLNPGWFAEDCVRLPIMRHLTKATEILAKSLGSDLEEIIVAEPTEARRTFWTSKTGRSWDALGDVDGQLSKEFPCPKCKNPIKCDYMNTKGDGYFQRKFQFRCRIPSCNMLSRSGYPLYIDKDILCARKFLDDLFRVGEESDLRIYLAGSIRTPYMNIDIEKGKRVKHIVHDTMVQHHVGLRPAGTTGQQWANIVLQKTLYEFKTLQASVVSHVNEIDRPFVKRVFAAYSQPSPFSIDLVGAVIRQGSFTEKMVKLEWTKPNYFRDVEDEIPLLHAIARYHAFLDLMAANPRSFNVPTLDIDLAWHTHQLMGHKYNLDCRDCVGRYIDHDDKVEESKLSNSFESTAALWKERFGIEYVHCGCPVPGKTMGKRFTKFLNAASSASTLKRDSLLYLIPPDREVLLTSTHPSDHNSVVFVPDGYKLRDSVASEQLNRRTKLLRLQATSGSTKTHKGTPIPRNDRDHTFPAAFMTPIPYYATSYCAANSGRLQSSSSGMAACAPAPFVNTSSMASFVC
ncbi:hypothetical protein H0H92_006711 [Tricholoma furcatifolium]|nr:hypothetical protein H0H92_006711 [Tricholoma furcatifolium]